MKARYDEFGLEIKETSKLSMLFLISIVCVVVISLIFLVLKLSSLEEKPKEMEETPISEGNDNLSMDDRSEYNEEANLVIPSYANGTIYEGNNLKLTMSSLQADKEGYRFHVSAIEEDGNSYIIRCNKIAIDNYETSATFQFHLNSYSSLDTNVRIPMEELKTLEISDFNTLTFFLDIQQEEKIQTVTRDVVMTHNILVDNTKRGLLKIDEKNSVLISYYKKVEDNTDTYLYFEIDNKSESNQLIKIKKLLLNDTLYEVKGFSQMTYNSTKSIFSLKIPKEDISSIEKIRISFFLFDTIVDGKATFITDEKELSIK